MGCPMERNLARVIVGSMFALAIMIGCLPARAALNASGPKQVESAAFPSSASTTTPNSAVRPDAVRSMTISGETTWYGPPYLLTNTYYADGSYGSIAAAEQAWWAGYHIYWNNDYGWKGPLEEWCSYTVTLYTPSPQNFGEAAGFVLNGYCGGGNPTYATAYSYNPGKNNGNPGGCCSAGDPINLATGNEYEEQNDYSVSGPLKFSRYYNSSAATASTHIGANWRHSFDSSIEYLTDGTTFQATVFRPDGKEVLFQKINGTWTRG